MTRVDDGPTPSGERWHPGDREFDLFVLDNLDGAELDRFREHLRSCPACSTRLVREARMEDEIEAALKPTVWARIQRTMARAISRMRWPVLVLAPATAATLLVLRLSPATVAPEFVAGAMNPTSTVRSAHAPKSSSGAAQSSYLHEQNTGSPYLYEQSATMIIRALPKVTPDQGLSMHAVLSSAQGRWSTDARDWDPGDGPLKLEVELPKLTPPPSAGDYLVEVVLCPRDLRYLLFRGADRCRSESFKITIEP